MAEKTSDKKPRNNYSFSIRKTDNPIIGEFVRKQSNFSESVRYLIIKFCRENGGVENISSRLNELIYLPDNFEINKNTDNENKSNIHNNEYTESKDVLQEPVKKEQEKIKVEKDREETEDEEFNEQISKVTEHNDEELNNDDNDVPECYR